MKITKAQYDELNFLQGADIEEFHKMLQELLDIDVRPITVYQYFDGEEYIGNSHDDMWADLVCRLGVKVEG